MIVQRQQRSGCPQEPQPRQGPLRCVSFFASSTLPSSCVPPSRCSSSSFPPPRLFPPMLSINHSRETSNLLRPFSFSLRPDTFPILLCHLFLPPEPFVSQDDFPSVLQENSDQFKEMHCNHTLQAQSHVIRTHAEMACRHPSFHHHLLSSEVSRINLSIQSSHPSVNLTGQLSNRITLMMFWLMCWVLFLALKTSTLSVGSSSFSLFLSSLSIISFLLISPCFISTPRCFCVSSSILRMS